MTEQALRISTLECRDGKKIGHLCLNSPKTLNALSIDMVDPMLDQLKKWKKNKNIAAVLISGAGNKAFCAGGDLRDVYSAMTSGEEEQLSKAEEYFSREYRLDYGLHTYPKPVIVWGSGIVMGGGMGLFMAGDVRIATETTMIAMPEITIALYPDVGGSYFLNQLPDHIGYFLALTGSVIGAQDAYSLKFANQLACASDFKDIIELLREQTWSESKKENTEIIHEIVETFYHDALDKIAPGNFEEHQETIANIFSKTDTHALIDEFLNLKSSDEWIQKAQSNLKSGSPLHAFIIHRQLLESQSRSLLECFKSEARLSTNIVRFTEFSEGIRALLIDKDRKPKWHFANHKDIPKDFVDRFFEEPWKKNPLSDLQ